MKTPLTRARIKQHLTYSLWKYIVMAIVLAVGWNIFYTVTAYRPPQSKIVDIYVYGYGEADALNAYMEHVRQNEMPDMEQMTTVFLTVDDQYGQVALSARVAAGEGDIYILPKDMFQSSASGGWFMALDDHTELQAICEKRGVSLDRCWRRENESTERHLYGLPLSVVPGVGQYIYQTDEFFISVLVTNGNEENVLRFLNILLRDMGPDAVVTPDTEPAA